ncbi:hypothetical protein lerEdw1_004781 [Lerista edwardsae]|nr:hypothetical protein lerEdw1_004781 [Lerista edwardsae]
MAAWQELTARGFTDFQSTAREQQSLGRRVFAYFSGDKEPGSGVSWCPDCVKAEPIVRAELAHLPEGSTFVYCQVGSKAYWKDPENEFRKQLKLTAVPTLLKYGTSQKLVEEECLKAELVRMLFTED